MTTQEPRPDARSRAVGTIASALENSEPGTYNWAFTAPAIMHALTAAGLVVVDRSDVEKAVHLIDRVNYPAYNNIAAVERLRAALATDAGAE